MDLDKLPDQRDDPSVVGYLLHSNLNTTDIIATTTESLGNLTKGVGDNKEDGNTDLVRVIKLCVLTLLFVLILCGNTFVLVALHNRKLKMNRMYFFLTHLSIADMITGFFNVLPQLAWEWTITFRGDNVLCKFVRYSQMLGPYLSSYVLVMTSIDRYQAICHPLSHSSSTHSRSRYMIITAWLISLLFCSPQAFIFSYKYIDDKDSYDCWATFPEPWVTTLYVTWYTFSIFIVPFCIIVYTHVFICHEIWLNWHSKRQSLMGKNLRNQVKVNGDTQAAPISSHSMPASTSNLPALTSCNPPVYHRAAQARHNSASETVLYYTHTNSLESHQLPQTRCSSWSRVFSCWSHASSHSPTPTSLQPRPPRPKCDLSSESFLTAAHPLHNHLDQSARPSLCSVSRGSNPRVNETNMVQATKADVIAADGLDHLGSRCVCHRIVEMHNRLSEEHTPRAIQADEKMLPSRHTNHPYHLKHAKSDSELCFSKQRKRAKRKAKREDNRLLKLYVPHDGLSPFSSSSSVSSSSSSSEKRHKLTFVGGRRGFSMTRLDDFESKPTIVALDQLLSWVREFRALMNNVGHPHKLKHPSLSAAASYSSTVECCYGRKKTPATKPVGVSPLNDCGCCSCCEFSNCDHQPRPCEPVPALIKSNPFSLRPNVRLDKSEKEETEEDKIVRLVSKYHPEGSLLKTTLMNCGNVSTNVISVHQARSITPTTTSNYSVPTTPNGGKVLVPRSYRIDNSLPASHNSLLLNSSNSTPINNGKQQQENHKQSLSNPRIHSMQGLTRAKIKTVKITLVVIICYVLCSSPFILSQLWAQWWPGAEETSFYRGPLMAVLMLLPSLNSCVNPWIYIFFNPNLVSLFFSTFRRDSKTINSNRYFNCAERNQAHRVLRKTLTDESTRPLGEGLKPPVDGPKPDEPGMGKKSSINSDQMSITHEAILSKQHNRLLQIKQMSEVSHSDLETSDHGTYSSSVTLNTSVSGNHHQVISTTPKMIKRKAVSAKMKTKTTKRRRISLQLDRMWNKITANTSESHRASAQ